MEAWQQEALFVKSKVYEYKPEDFDSEEEYTLEMQKRRDFEKTWGFSYVDTWNLEGELAAWLLPRIAYFREHSHSFPMRLAKLAEDGHTILNEEEAVQRWDSILKEIINGLHVYLDGGCYEEDTRLQWEHAKELLFEYYEDLWD